MRRWRRLNRNIPANGRDTIDNRVTQKRPLIYIGDYWNDRKTYHTVEQQSTVIKGLLPQAAEAIRALAYEIYWAREFSPNDPDFCFFLGSGCSLPLAPSSQKLAEKLLGEMYPRLSGRKRDQRFEREFGTRIPGATHLSLEAICEAYKETRGPEALFRSFKAKFGKVPSIHEGYRTLGELVKDDYVKVIFTTNIDTLMEDTFNDIGLGFDIFVDLADYMKRPSLSRSSLYKLHGSWNKHDMNVAWRDVQQLHPMKQRHLRHFFESHSFIFVGYSARDMDILSTLWQIEPSVVQGLRIYSFTLSGGSSDMKTVLARFGSSKCNVAMGNVHHGGDFFSALVDELERAERREKNVKRDD